MTATVDSELHSAGPDDGWPGPDGRRPVTPQGDHRRALLAVAVVAVLGAAVIGAVVTADNSSTPETLALTGATANTPADQTIQAVALPDLEGELGQNELESEAEVGPQAERADGGCTIGALSVRLGATGAGVTCAGSGAVSEIAQTAAMTVLHRCMCRSGII